MSIMAEKKIFMAETEALTEKIYFWWKKRYFGGKNATFISIIL